MRILLVEDDPPLSVLLARGFGEEGHVGSRGVEFAFASVLERHFGYRLAWPTVTVATYVGTSRLHDNDHYLSDVVFAAALGTAVGWTVVGRHGRTKYALVPAIGPRAVMFTMTRTNRLATNQASANHREETATPSDGQNEVRHWVMKE